MTSSPSLDHSHPQSPDMFGIYDNDCSINVRSNDVFPNKSCQAPQKVINIGTL